MVKRLVERQILAALLPYTAAALIILTFILLAQQFSKFAEIIGAARAPFSFVLFFGANLLPSVLVFTLPMAMLVGTATGFCRLGSDSELTAMRAAGIGNRRIIAPVIVFGSIICGLTLYVAFEAAPTSASALRTAALDAAIRRLESPVEPRSFYTEMPGKVIYVRDGDQQTGQWGRVFIHWQESDGRLRLVTARSGRIDASAERAELVLADAIITTLPSGGGGPQAFVGAITTERSAQLRLRDDRLSSGRSSLIRRMRERDVEPDEMGWRRLLEGSRQGGASVQRRGIQTALHKKLSLCAAPIAFALLGAGMGLRVRRGGRALGVTLSMIAMLLYYLISLAGEQLARGGAIPPAAALWSPFLLTLATSAVLLRQRGSGITFPRGLTVTDRFGGSAGPKRNSPGGVALIKGLLNKSVLYDLTRYFIGNFLVLTLIFMLFTLFELLRFIVINSSSGGLVIKYLFFLIPLISVTVAPMSVLLAVLVTFTLMVRRSEIIAWWGSGQSIYRIAVPAFLFALLISGAVWLIQERLMPETNKRQNQLRSQIRGGVARFDAAGGRRWLATENARRVYTYYFDVSRSHLQTPTVFEFDGEGIHLVRMWWSERGSWRPPASHLMVFDDATVLEFGGAAFTSSKVASLLVEGERTEIFKPPLNDPAEMNTDELSAYINILRSLGVSSPSLLTALERKRANLLSPLVMVLISAPASLAFGRRSTVAALCLAVILGVCYWGATGVFYHFGTEGYLPALIAAWVPQFLFSFVGIYMLSRVRT